MMTSCPSSGYASATWRRSWQTPGGAFCITGVHPSSISSLQAPVRALRARELAPPRASQAAIVNAKPIPFEQRVLHFVLGQPGLAPRRIAAELARLHCRRHSLLAGARVRRVDSLAGRSRQRISASSVQRVTGAKPDAARSRRPRPSPPDPAAPPPAPTASTLRPRRKPPAACSA